MAKDDDDDDSLPPLGENCDKFLDQAKKGQPRSFLLVCKGNKVKYLAVKKKPVKKAELAEAKKSGYKGDAYFGVITGKGMDLVFNLSMEDGYTAEPCKDKSLKDFLEEHADFKCKPTFAIVATAPAIPFDEDDLKNPLIARFLKMDEQISAVLDAGPDAEAELTKTVSEIRLLLQDGSFNDAETKINALEARLTALLNGEPTGQTQAPASPSAIQPPAPPPLPDQPVNNDELKAKLQAAFDKLVPQIKQAVATYPDRKVELLTPVALIKKQMDSGELQNAKAGILSLGQLLKSLAPSEPVQQVNPQRAEYQKKLADLQPLYQQALQNNLGDTGKFRSVMAYAREQAEAGVYENAIKAIDRLALAVQQATGSLGNPQATDPAVSIMKLGKARVEWLTTRNKAVSDLAGLKAIIAEEFRDDGEQASALAEAMKTFDQIIATVENNLHEQLDAILNAEVNARVPLVKTAKATIAELVNKLTTDEVIMEIDGNEFDPTTNVVAPLNSKLQEISAALG